MLALLPGRVLIPFCLATTTAGRSGTPDDDGGTLTTTPTATADRPADQPGAAPVAFLVVCGRPIPEP
ncbi:MAG TPA: hypothetical protein VLT33_41365 [Labilithrix sp.]|nr:hypothetical protein [Labilithrix sp.]